MDALASAAAAIPAAADDISLPQMGGWLAHLRAIYCDDAHGLERAVAERIFVASNRAKGALYPFGFALLSPTDREPWLERARRLLAIDAGRQ